MNKILSSKPVAFFATIGLTAITLTGNAFAAEGITDGINAARPNGVAENLDGQAGLFANVSNTLIYLVGAISVIFLIIGGLRYVISGGDAKNVEAAKNTILYAVIGVIVALIAFAIVNFVVGQFAA